MILTETFRDSLKHPASIILGATGAFVFICCVDVNEVKSVQSTVKQIFRDPPSSAACLCAGIGALVIIDRTLPHVDSLFRLALGKSR